MGTKPASENLTQRIQRHEGLRLFPYKDSVGKLTIGYGRNLDDVGISDTEAYLLCQHDIATAQQSLVKLWPWVFQQPPIVVDVLTEMVFQMGAGSVGQFHNMRDAMLRGDRAAAADAMLDSKWAKEDSPARAKELADLVRGA